MILTDIIAGKTYEISAHALDRLAMRGVREEHILATIRKPDTREWNEGHETWNYFRWIQPNGKRFRLLVAVNENVYLPKIVTVIIQGE